MKAWPILLITACQPHSNCEVGSTAHGAQALFYTDTLEGPLILELWPALPISDRFEDLVVLDEPWLQVLLTQTPMTVDLERYEGITHTSDNSQLTVLLPAIFEDQDGDGQHSQGEPYWALSKNALVYAKQLECGTWGALLQTGWNAVTFNEDGLAASDLNAIQLATNLAPVETFSVKIEAEKDEDLAVIIASERIWAEDFWVSPLLDQPSEPSMEITLPTLPPDAHLQEQDVSGRRFLDWYYAVELPLLYRDENTSGHFDTDDTIVEAFCVDEQPIRMGHYPEADHIDEAFYLVKEDLQPGWGLYQEHDANPWKPIDPASHVLTPGNCPLP